MTTENAIDTIIAASTEAQSPVDNSEQAQTADAPQDAEKAQEAEAPETPEQRLEKLEKALARKNKAIDKRTALFKYEREQREKLERELQELRGTKAEPKDELKPENFETVEDYVNALADAKVKAALNEGKVKQEQEREQSEKARYQAEKAENFAAKADEFRSKIADFDTVISDAADETLAPHVQEALLEADSGPLVAYLIAKDGLFDKLNSLSPTRAAIEIAKLEAKAEALITKPAPVSKAPAPMKPNRGTAPGTKDITQMSGKELRELWGI